MVTVQPNQSSSIIHI